MLRSNRASSFVAGLAGVFGALVLSAAAVAGQLLALGARTATSGTVAVLFPLAAWGFFAIALFVAGIVTANTCTTVIAGQTRALALQRLLGAPASALRARLSRDGLRVGAVSALIGIGIGVVTVNAAVLVLRSAVLPGLEPVVPPSLAIVWAAVTVTVAVAFRVASRRVLALVPVQALDAAIESDVTETTAWWRPILATTAFALGAAGLALSMVLGATTPLAVLLALAAGFVSFSGLVLASPLLLPPVLRLTASLGRVPMAALAGRNALRTPGRSSRATVGLLIAVTLVVTFSVGIATYETMLVRQVEADPEYYRGIHDQFSAVSVMLTSLLVGAGAIAAAGVVNVSSLTVAQRAREFGLLRALGATRAQIAALVTVETSVMVLTALVLGTVLGTSYGWAGAYSLLGATHGAEIIPPVLPLGTVVTVVAGTVVVALASVAGPVRRATRVPPTAALALD